jgi:hypothetical protein
MADLLPISTNLAQERQLDVIFVHGLGGDPLTTWRHGNDASSSWPHWLAETFAEQIGVWSLGYAASPTKLKGVGAAIGQMFGKPADPDAGQGMSLTRRAEKCLDRLVKSGIGQRPCMFITHSLGGCRVIDRELENHEALALAALLWSRFHDGTTPGKVFVELLESGCTTDPGPAR